MNNKAFKAVTFSFDDGNTDDIRLIEIMNKYGLKGTFNLNSGNITNTNSWNFADKKAVRHINYTEHADIYKGHEIACHSYTHPRLETLSKETVYNEIFTDKKILSCLFDCKIRGMAYPFGTYNDTVLEVLKECGIEYCRTVKVTHSFDMPENPLLLHPTCHFTDSGIFDIAERFLKLTCDKPQVFYIWGHSYELVTEDDWQKFEKLCQTISNKKYIHYCTNIEVFDILKE